MTTLTAGHKYELKNFEAKDHPGQVIQFIEKSPQFDCAPGQDPYPNGKLVTVNDGTTNEEVLNMLIDRMQYLLDKFPSEETACSIEHLKIALYAQQSRTLELTLERTLERTQRGVEGKHLK